MKSETDKGRVRLMSTSKSGTGKRRWIDRLTLADRRARAWDQAVNWGSTPEDRALHFPCDDYVRAPHKNYYRAIDVDAPPEIVYRWLCQLHIAPYSYDYIDNYGRRSPRRLIPGADELEVGQRWFVKIFELVEFEPAKQLTMRIARARWFWGADVGCTYLIRPQGPCGCRIAVDVVTYAKPGIYAEFRRKTYPWVELIMMRKQLITFKKLAEEEARRVGSAVANGVQVPTALS